MDIVEWAQKALPGARVVYHKRKAFPFQEPKVDAGLGSAMKAHEAGLVLLAQRRVGDSFHYEATRISPGVRKWLDRVSASVQLRWVRGA